MPRTAEFDTYVGAWEADLPDPVDMFVEAIRTGDAELRERAATIAAAKNIDYAALKTRALERVAPMIIGEIRKTSGPNFDASGKRFAAAVKKLIDADKIISVSATTDDLAKPSSTTAQRQQWPAQPALASEVQAAYESFIAAGTLCGLLVGESDGKVHESVRIPLVVDVTTAKTRRVLFDAWGNTSHRLGRWGALIAAGITIRPCPLSAYAAIEPDRGVEVVQVDRIVSAGGKAVTGTDQIKWDVEDGSPRPA